MTDTQIEEYPWIKLPSGFVLGSADFVAIVERAWNDGVFRFALVTHPTGTLKNESYSISDEEFERIRRFARNVRLHANQQLRELVQEGTTRLPPIPIEDTQDPWINCRKMESLGHS